MTSVRFPSDAPPRRPSSLGGDASFDPQPLPAKHASTTAQIVPFLPPPASGDIEGVYYLGGGGESSRIDSVLTDWTYLGQPIPCWLEMGTTGMRPPGRIAMANNNEYTGRTDIGAGPLQLMAPDAIPSMSVPILGTYNNQVLNGLYDYQVPNTTPYTWKGPGMLLLDPGQNKDWNLSFYGLLNRLNLENGVIGWTGDVNITSVPGNYVNNPSNPFLVELGRRGGGGRQSPWPRRRIQRRHDVHAIRRCRQPAAGRHDRAGSAL